MSREDSAFQYRLGSFNSVSETARNTFSIVELARHGFHHFGDDYIMCFDCDWYLNLRDVSSMAQLRRRHSRICPNVSSYRHEAGLASNVRYDSTIRVVDFEHRGTASSPLEDDEPRFPPQPTFALDSDWMHTSRSIASTFQADWRVELEGDETLGAVGGYDPNSEQSHNCIPSFRGGNNVSIPYDSLPYPQQVEDRSSDEDASSAGSPPLSPASSSDDDHNAIPNDRRLCKICWINDWDTIIMKCGHVVCHNCSVNLQGNKCPHCRGIIEDFVDARFE